MQTNIQPPDVACRKQVTRVCPVPLDPDGCGTGPCQRFDTDPTDPDVIALWEQHIAEVEDRPSGLVPWLYPRPLGGLDQ